jgi:hypothetical protein
MTYNNFLESNIDAMGGRYVPVNQKGTHFRIRMLLMTPSLVIMG